jgi:hypothetical protein
MSTTRKIGFTVLLMLLLSPISGPVRAGGETKVGIMLMEKAAGGLVGWGAGQAMGSLFPEPEASPSLQNIKDDIHAGFTKLGDQLNATETRLTQKIDDSWKKTHLNLLQNDGKVPLESAITSFNPFLAAAGGTTLQDNDGFLADIILKSTNYSKLLSTDIRIGEGIDGYNGFWRSFNPYVSNHVLTFSFFMEQWAANQKQPKYTVKGNLALFYASKNLANLEGIYNHLEKDVPTLPVYPAITQNGKPQQQRVNCAVRTDPDTQLFTSKGEFISRYRGVHDVADGLPDPTRYSMMYAYCRSNMYSDPNVYYGWKNVNHSQWLNAGQLVGPHDLAEACRRTVTFGTCQDHRNAYGCNSVPFGSGKEDGNIIDKTKRSRGNTKYTKYLWDEGPHAIQGVIAKSIRQGELSVPSYGNFATHKFNNYVKKYENSICVSAPDRKNIAAQIPDAPVLPHLTDELFEDTPSRFIGMGKSKLYDSYLPLTVTKVPGKVSINKESALNEKDVDAYFFIKRNHNSKIPELSKPYQSPMSAVHARSVNFFTEFKDQGLDDAYCQIASLVGIGNLLLKGIEKKISNKGNYPDWNHRITQQSVSSLRSKYIRLSYKLGITKENVKRCDRPFHKISENIPTSHDDIFMVNLDKKDHALISCMKLAAIDAYEAKAQKCRIPDGGPIPTAAVTRRGFVMLKDQNTLTCDRGKGEYQRPPRDNDNYRRVRAACYGTYTGKWDPSMGMRNPLRPCMIVNSCGVDNRSDQEKACNPHDIPIRRSTCKAQSI